VWFARDHGENFVLFDFDFSGGGDNADNLDISAFVARR
jgi:hypothetical protein